MIIKIKEYDVQTEHCSHTCSVKLRTTEQREGSVKNNYHESRWLQLG